MPARSEFCWKKYRKERNQFLIFWLWLFPNVLWLASQLLLRHRWMQEWHHSIRLYHQSRCNHFHSPHQCCFRFHCCRLHHIVVITVWQRFIFSFVSVSFNLSLFVADQFLQDSFGEASVWLDASLVYGVWGICLALALGVFSVLSDLRKFFPSIILIIFSPSPSGFPLPSPLPSSFWNLLHRDA